MNKLSLLFLVAVCLFTACTERMICPAYQSTFILDDNYREELFSPFTFGPDTVPKENWDAQRHKTDWFVDRLWKRPERAPLENPYLMARIFQKRPFWKLDFLKPEVIQYSQRDTVYLEDQLMDSTAEAEPSFFVLTVPERSPGFREDQIEYNRRFGHLFPQPPPPPEPVDSTQNMEEFLADTAATDSTRKKKGLFGMFKKKNRTPKPKKEKRKKPKDQKNNEEGNLPEDDD